MKKILVILTFFCSFLLLGSAEESGSNEFTVPGGKEDVLKENTSTTQQSIEILSKDLRSGNFLTPRRNVQVFNTSSHARVAQQINKLLRVLRVKGEDRLCRILEFNTYCQTVKLSSLLCRRGYHIYALRKIVI
ncbi:MAG: hypothetical protein LUH10_09840 [Tannerellaceae bacterium]|nr:hypothetical protein [Tannerellaceae bacterium]